jgi:hypothetical protein
MNGIPAETQAAAPVRAPIQAPPRSLAAPKPIGFIRAAWDHWKQIARAIGVVQTRLLMVLMYFVLVFPLGLIMRIRSDPLHLKPRAGSNWTPHSYEPPSLDSARRQF